MAIQTLHDTGSAYQITAKMDGGVYGTGIADCVCAGIGGEMAVTSSANSFDITIGAGSQAIIGGAFFKLTGNDPETFTIPSNMANQTFYLCAEIDLGQANGSRGLFACRTSAQLRTDNLNGSGTIRDLVLYQITMSSTGVSSKVDKRVIKGNGTSVEGYTIKVLTQSAYNNLSTKDANTLYFIY